MNESEGEWHPFGYVYGGITLQYYTLKLSFDDYFPVAINYSQVNHIVLRNNNL